jgi:YbbR domain-containing protein
VKRRLPVQPDWNGKLAEGLILEDVRVVPDAVVVVGGSQMLESVATIYTQKIQLEGITGSGSISVNLVLQPSFLKLQGGSKSRVDVIYKVKERSPAAS